MKEEITAKIQADRVIAIIRLQEALQVGPMVATLVGAGINVLEITSNTPDYGAAIQSARQKYPDVAVGAGTITNTALALEAISHGAQFLVTPNMNVEVIAAAHHAGIPAVMGAMTPTEIALGIDHGADFIKLFPASLLGVAYLKALLGPFRGAKFLAVGGIGAENAPEWFRAGVSGIGVGGSIMAGETTAVTQAIKKLLHSIKS
ncbi:bifunctional 4-hydroxy-2-oxoglutarate aldolase/2-dehydro-3-deoxy-phosphogluconate aldolase [Parapedobacter pyrenivorans]|uniref:bifunctional 4-hydroxy-2-oxoglutarate aldolase/2-dehydro-3-deoxy-phosphogluconate aldolase n=1 Tax=Parapedobacter pyrenivorans TaxID=1305674 RepID=UPI0033425FC4